MPTAGFIGVPAIELQSNQFGRASGKCTDCAGGTTISQRAGGTTISRQSMESSCCSLLQEFSLIDFVDWWNNHFPVSEDSSGVKDSLTLMPSGIMTTLFWELPKPCTYHPTLPTDSVDCEVYVPVEQPFPGYRWNNHFPVHDASEHVRCDFVDP